MADIDALAAMLRRQMDAHPTVDCRVVLYSELRAILDDRDRLAARVAELEAMVALRYPDDLGTPCTAKELSERCHELARRLARPAPKEQP